MSSSDHEPAPDCATAPLCTGDSPLMGVAITAFRSEPVICACLDSLLASRAEIARVVITDNASNDATCAVIRDWAKANNVSLSEAEAPLHQAPETWLTLLHAPVNGGFAYATNRALEALLADPAINLFWVLNPDCIILQDTAAKYREAGRDQNFSLMGGRTLFEGHSGKVQTDGGRVSRWTGVCESVNWGVPSESATFPEAASLDFITGANCVASRRFLEEVGLMEEDYFLYYEEVDWAFRRSHLPLRLVPEAQIKHHGGTAIGTGSVGRRPSPFANYFNYRNRMRFLRRYSPGALPIAMAYASAKAAQLAGRGAFDEAWALVAGMLGMTPPRKVREALSPEARLIAFGGAR